MTCTIALVEDDQIVRDSLSDLLRDRGFEVDAFADRATASRAFAERLPDLAILDVALGEEHGGGFELCRELRQRCKLIPVIFLTCHDDEADRISGLRVGADDYVSKSNSFQYIAVRIDTLISRRRAMREALSDSFRSSTIEVGKLKIDTATSMVTWGGGTVELPLTEYWMVTELAASPSVAKSVDDLMKAARMHVSQNTIVCHIRAIRQRFREVDPQFDAIKTERGIGYRWHSVDGCAQTN